MSLALKAGSRVKLEVKSYTTPGMMYIVNPYIIFPDMDHDYDLMVVCRPEDEIKAKRYIISAMCNLV